MNRTLAPRLPMLSKGSNQSTSSVIRDLLRVVDRPGMLSMAGGLPAPELLPVDRIATAANRVLDPEGASAQRALQYSPTEGLGELRNVVASRRSWSADSVVITTGSQQGLDLIARSMIDPGDVVVVEAPGYLGSLQAFRAGGADFTAVAGDEDGMRVDLLEEHLRGGLRPKLVSVVPDFANPSGATLSEGRRRLLARLADHYGFLIVEDNPYGELRWDGDTVAPLGTMTELAVTLGSASKILAPGLRIGWLHGPEWLRSAVVKAKQTADLHTSSMDQLVVADVLADGSFMDEHLGVIRSTYERRCDALASSLHERCGDDLDVSRPSGGMFLWARWNDGRSTASMLESALDHGVAFVPGSAFSVDGRCEDSMRLCFSTLSIEQLDEAVSRLVACSQRPDGLFAAGRA